MSAHRPRPRPADLFTLFIIVVLAAALIIASEWVLRASVLVLVLGSVGLAAAIAQLIADVFYRAPRSEEHTSELQSLMRISYAVFCLKKKTKNTMINSI